MNIITKISIYVVLAISIIYSPTYAIDLDLKEIGFPIEEIEVHGFFSQGYMKSSNNNVFGSSKDGTLDLREFGINFSGYLTKKVLLAAQFTGYTLGEQGADKVNLHYGLVDFKLSEPLAARIGRVRVPLGLYNETRDIDMLYTQVFLPQSIYPEISRDYYAAADAAGIYGGFELGCLGFLSYQAHTGKLVNNDDPASDLTYMFRGFGFENIRYENGRSSGAQVLWNTPLEGFRCAWSWRRIDNTRFADRTIVPGPGADPIKINVKTLADNLANQIWSVEYQVDKLTLVSELSRMSIDAGGAPHTTAWYAGIDYDLTEKMSIGGNYSSYSEERKKGGNPDELIGYQRTVSLYGKYSITDSWLVKAQVDMNRGTAQNHAMMRSTNDEVSSTMFSFKTTWSF